MDTETNERAPLSATASAFMKSQGTTGAGSRDPGGDPVTVDSIHPLTNPDPSGPHGHTIEMRGDVGDGHTVMSVDSTHDADSTPFWDSQATAPSWVESTLGAWQSTVPVSDARRPEVVPGFKIVSELGRGGMGIVYKAQEEGLKRFVALKMIRGDWHGDAEHLARFDIEAEAVARLNHPNIVCIYRIGKVGDIPYVSLELLEGGTLKERLAGTLQPFREAAALLATLAQAVSAAHTAGILHRDLKPSNILFDHAGIPKIADFGLAKRLDIEEGQTQTGQLLGTPGYMAPEQAKGWDRDIGPAADIYSLGAILYEMLTGRPPLKGTTAVETLKLVQEEDPVPPSQLRPKLPFDLETICLKCIARDPDKRYSQALGLAEDLTRFLAGESILARRTSPWERVIKRARKRPVTAVLVAVAMVAVLLAAGVGARQHARARAQEKRETDRITGLLQEADQGLVEAERTLAQNRWNDALPIISRILTRIEPESDPRIALKRDHAEHLQATARHGHEDQIETEQARARFRRFLGLRDDALFRDTARFADGLGNSVPATCQAARLGLAVFGQAANGDEWALCDLPPALSAQERDEVKSGFHQLLLILADAVSQSSGGSPTQRAEAALQIIKRADGLRSRATRAYHLRRADFLELKGDRQGAAGERHEAEQRAPADAFDFFLLGRESIRRSDWTGAIAQLSAAVQRQHDFFWADCLMAICYLQTNQPAAARFGFSACLSRKPDRPWLYMLRGIANAGIARQEIGGRGPGQLKAAAPLFEAAEKDYRTALELLGDKQAHAELYYALLLNRGMMRLVREDLPAAAADFEEAIRLNDQRFEAFVDLGQVYQRQNRTDDALKQFAKAIKLRPSWAALYRARAHVFLGLRDLSPELRETATSELEAAIKGVSAERRAAASQDLAESIRDETPGNHLIAADWTKLAALFREARRLDDARKACETALAIAPQYARAHVMRIKVLLDLGQNDDLIRSCDAVLASTKPTAELYELRGIAKNAIGDFSGAFADYTRSLDLCPGRDKPRLLRFRGWSNLANEAFRAAVEDFDKAIGLAPTSADAYLGRGTARARIGLYREAESDADMALKHGNQSGRFTFRVARIYALAAVAVGEEARKKRRNSDKLVRRYQDRAFTLVRLALERTPVKQRAAFFREKIKSDLAMGPIRRQLEALERRGFDRPAQQ